MNVTYKSLFVALFASALLVPSVQAKNGADDPAGHVSKGRDDASRAGGNRSDNPIWHDRLEDLIKDRLEERFGDIFEDRLEDHFGDLFEDHP